MHTATSDVRDPLELQLPEPAYPAEALRRFGDYIGAALKVMRVKRSLKQQDVAERLSAITGDDSLSQAYISRVESGTTGVSLDRLGLFAVVFSCSPSTLVGMAEFLTIQSSREPAEHQNDLVDASQRALDKRVRGT